MILRDLNINKDWTLFLDRDGVINKRLVDAYVKNWVEFEFIDGVFGALKYFKGLFGKIVVVTNQQGIGKRLYRVEDLELIHGNMLYEVKYHGGKIDKVYFSPYLAAEQHPTRKPGIGMALLAKIDFPEINFSKSLMIGDSMSDMQFGRTAGMKTVFISEMPTQDVLIDFNFVSLAKVAEHLQNS
jgi:D-glycero-D-manno-heptose 1,7-bisphosphate phosphatase